MRAWFMIVAMTLGLAGWWVGQGKAGRTTDDATQTGMVTAMDDPNPAPTPR